MESTGEVLWTKSSGIIAPNANELMQFQDSRTSLVGSSNVHGVCGRS